MLFVRGLLLLAAFVASSSYPVQTGEVAFQAGRYDDAPGYFQRAFALSRRSALLYDIAAAADRLRRDELALEHYETYRGDGGGTCKAAESCDLVGGKAFDDDCDGMIDEHCPVYFGVPEPLLGITPYQVDQRISWLSPDGLRLYEIGSGATIDIAERPALDAPFRLGGKRAIATTVAPVGPATWLAY